MVLKYTCKNNFYKTGTTRKYFIIKIMRISKWLNAGCIVFLLVLASSSCKKMTDEHNAVTNSDLNNSLYEKISNTPELSLFAGYLSQTGYDKLLSASGNYTVFCPG
jgi:hypothetical protein